MTRRIDELGRLVIPKEIRKNLKIKDNDLVEIMVVDNKIQLIREKLDLYNDLVISLFINILKKTLDKNILYTSRDKIVDYALLNNGIIDNEELNEEIVNIIENRDEVTNYLYNNMLYNIYPLIVNGDLFGSLIIYGEKSIDDKYLELIKFSKRFLENYLE